MDTRSAQLELAHDTSAPRVARRFLVSVLSSWGVPDDTVESSQLLTSELVSNAILHGNGPIEMIVSEIDAETGAIRVEVCNGGEGQPTMRHARRDELSGRGLHLIDDISTDWGTKHVDGQTLVWFDIRPQR